MFTAIAYGLLGVSLVWGVASIVKWWNLPKVEQEKTEQKQGRWSFLFRRREQRDEAKKVRQERLSQKKAAKEEKPS